MILIPVWTFFLLGAWHGSVSTGTPVDRTLLVFGILSFTAIVGAGASVVLLLFGLKGKESDESTD